MRGEGPIMQIAGIGTGKSLSFILPAYYSLEGTTIIVILLVLL
jgi:superfamily II DNA helicase RecQ